MDPNATLQLIRETVAQIEAGDPDLADLARELSEHVANLDEWLGRGGFLPNDWQR